MLVNPDDTLSERIQSLGTNFSYFADKLGDPTVLVSAIWPAQPTLGHSTF
jgi:hypothetical protein